MDNSNKVIYESESSDNEHNIPLVKIAVQSEKPTNDTSDADAQDKSKIKTSVY